MDINPETEREYVPFIVNRGLSFSSDTILYANEMNLNPNTDKRMQYDYLYNSVRRRKRYDKWMKQGEQDEEAIEAIMLVYKVSRKRAFEYLNIIPKEKLASILKSRGGTNAK
jgi:trimethylamine:corrinoid methyltransferase-like protein